MRTPLKLLPPLLGLCLLASALACGDDKDDDSASEEELVGDCKLISEACHEVDEGESEAHECHETAHAGKAADCTEHVAHCVETCAGLAGDGGTHAH